MKDTNQPFWGIPHSETCDRRFQAYDHVLNVAWQWEGSFCQAHNGKMWWVQRR